MGFRIGVNRRVTSLVTSLALFAFSALVCADESAEPGKAESATIRTGIMGAGLDTDNMDQLVAFYTHGLGMAVLRKIEFEKATEIILGSGDGQGPVLMLFQKHERAEKVEKQGGDSIDKLLIKTNDAKALAGRLKDQGYTPGEVEANPVNQMMVFWVYDPDGNALEIVQYPMP